MSKAVFNLKAVKTMTDFFTRGTYTATWLGGWVSVRHTPALYQNG